MPRSHYLCSRLSSLPQRAGRFHMRRWSRRSLASRHRRLDRLKVSNLMRISDNMTERKKLSLGLFVELPTLPRV